MCWWKNPPLNNEIFWRKKCISVKLSANFLSDCWWEKKSKIFSPTKMQREEFHEIPSSRIDHDITVSSLVINSNLHYLRENKLSIYCILLDLTVDTLPPLFPFFNLLLSMIWFFRHAYEIHFHALPWLVVAPSRPLNASLM